MDNGKLLETLDFNGTHSGDPLVATYFRQAASAIRALEGQRDHWRSMVDIEREKARVARTDALALGRALNAAGAAQALPA